MSAATNPVNLGQLPPPLSADQQQTISDGGTVVVLGFGNGLVFVWHINAEAAVLAWYTPQHMADFLMGIDSIMMKAATGTQPADAVQVTLQ